MLRWVRRVAAIAGLLVVAGLAWAITDFSLWRADIVRRIEHDPDRRIASTALGDIEYAVVGEGAPVLVLHGAPGGYDQGLIGARAPSDAAPPNAMTIAVSRPGYLGTPLSSGATPQQQADLFAALLNELGIDRVIVSASSAGGPSGLQFALRHPDRTMGLMLFSAGVRTNPDNPPDMKGVALLAGDMWLWATAKFFPSAMTANYDRTDPVQAAEFQDVIETIAPLAARWAGNRNDVEQAWNPEVDNWPLEDISVPTLIVHGDADPLSPYENALYALSRIPNAELFTIEGGGHFAFTSEQRRQISSRVAEFIESVAARHSDRQGAL